MESKVYLYSRVSTSEQTLEQQERTAYEWLKHHHMTVSEVVSDEGVSGGVSYKDRNLGKVLLPKMNAGDVLIVSEISRLGRSMFDLSTLIHTELKKRHIRLVVVSMGIDLRCDKLTAMDELILNNFSFAAQLEKQLIQERTLSSLQVKKQQGVALGGAAKKWKESFNKKSKIQRQEENMKRGKLKNMRHLASRDVQVFLKVIKNIFADACKGDDAALWDWAQVNTKGENKDKVLRLMRDYKEMDESGALFAKWNFEDDAVKLQVKLAAYIQTVRKSLGIKK